MAKLLIKHNNAPSIETTAKITLIGGGFALISACDFYWLNLFSWRLHNGKYKQYAYRRFAVGKITYTKKMHREIKNCPPDEETHHIDLDGLNNCRNNLENLTPHFHRLKHGKTQ